MTSRPSTTEFNALLGSDEFRDRGSMLELTAASAERLALAIRWARTRGRKVTVSRDRFDSIGTPDLMSCLIRAECAAPISRVEDALGSAQLTLGPLSPLARKLTVGAWLSGPHLGLRAIPGGRLETAALALEAVLWSGEVYRSHASPRAAAGPDLDFALLGGNDAVGLITSATLRAFPKPTTEDRVSVQLQSPAQAALILRDALGHEAVPARAELAVVDGALTFSATFANLAFRAHRDAARFREAAQLLGARELNKSVKSVLRDGPAREFEASWEALPAALAVAASHPVGIFRIARESVILGTPLSLDGDGVAALDAPAEPAPWLTKLGARLRGDA